MIDAVNGTAGRIHAFFRTQTAPAWHSAPAGNRPEEFAVKDGEQAKNAEAPTRVHGKPVPVSRETFSALLDAQEASTARTTDTGASLLTRRAAEDDARDRALDALFANDRPSPAGRVELDSLPPLLTPSTENLQAIQQHASARFKQLLADYDIPRPPLKSVSTAMAGCGSRRITPMPMN